MAHPRWLSSSRRPRATATGARAGPDAGPPSLTLTPNPDILAEVSALPTGRRPGLVIGFAAETEALMDNARAKHRRKGCDWLVANDVSPGTGVFGGTQNHVVLLSGEGEDDWGLLSKAAIGERLAERIAAALTGR